MKRMLMLCLYTMMLGTALLGCQQGVTDVGNPNIVTKPPQNSPDTASPGPTVGQLIGGYSLPQPVSASEPSPGGSPSPTAAPAIPTCKTDAQQNQSITATSSPTQIILSHFLDYGSATENILATYDSRTGAIAFTINDASAAITSCSGTASSGTSGVEISLTCKPATSGDSDCQVTFNKE